MADENKNKIDDIFQLMAQADTETAEPSAGAVDPFAIGEITYRDSQGNLKTISNSAPQPAAISAVAVRAGKQLDIEAEVKRIVTQAQLSFPSTELQKRFESIIRSRLKGIRGPIQTREMLLNSPLLGGMGFTDLTADRVLAIINGENSQLHEKLRQNVSQESFADLRAEATKLLDDQDDNEIAEVEPDKITPDAKFVEDLGMDSMMALEVLASVEKKYKIKIPEENLMKLTTLDQTVELVKSFIDK